MGHIVGSVVQKNNDKPMPKVKTKQKANNIMQTQKGVGEPHAKRPRKAGGYVPVQNHTKKEPQPTPEPQAKRDDTPNIHKNLWK
jgi:hypothetical protein